MLRGSFGILQSGPKGVILEIGVAFWSQVYVYILSMVKSCVRVINTPGFFCADHGLSMDRNWRGSTPRSFRARPAINRYRPDTDAEDELPLARLLIWLSWFTPPSPQCPRTPYRPPARTHQGTYRRRLSRRL